jgi:hypothetical protein
MPLKTIQARADHVESVRRAIQAISPRGAFAALSPARLHTSVPHPVYLLKLEDLAKGKSVSSAARVGTRFLLVQDGKPVAAAELREPGPRTAPVTAGNSPAQLNRGPFVQGTQTAIEHAETLHEVRSSDYELRLLRVPALYLEALWLHGPQGADIVIPVEPAPPELVAGRSYSPSELVGALQMRAVQLAKFDSSPTS